MLELKSISKTFNPGTVNEKCALHDLSLSVPDGDFVTIIGANGAGKSTLFGAIGGNFLTDSGEILLDGPKRDVLAGAPALQSHRPSVSGSDARQRAGHDDRRKSGACRRARRLAGADSPP